MLLLGSFFQIRRITSSEKWLTTSLLFFFFGFWKMPKIWVCRTTLNGEKEEDGLKSQLSKISPSLNIIATSFSVILLNANNIVPLCLSPDQARVIDPFSQMKREYLTIIA